MNINGNNLSISLLQNTDLPYLPTELWEIILYIKMLLERPKRKENLWETLHADLYDLSRETAYHLEEPHSLMEYLCGYGEWGFTQPLPLAIQNDYHKIYEENCWDFGESHLTIEDMNEYRLVESTNRESMGKGDKVAWKITRNEWGTIGKKYTIEL